MASSRDNRTTKQPGAVLRALDIDAEFLQSLPCGIALVSIDGAVEDANREAQQILGLNYDQLTQRYVADFATQTMREDMTDFPVEEYPVSIALTTGEPAGPVTVGIRHQNEDILWATFAASPVSDPQGGKWLGAIVTFLNVTAEVNAGQALQVRTAEWEGLMRNLPADLIEMSEQGEILFTNHSGRKAVATEAVGQTIHDYLTADDAREQLERIARVLETGEPETYYISATTHGTRRHFGNTMWRVERQAGPPVVANLSNDLTQVFQLQEELEHRAEHDSLTGLGNRAAFLRTVDETLEDGNPEHVHAILYVDLDQFQLINDTCGHEAGDQLLRQVAQGLRESLPTGTFIARTGGDEFGIVLTETSEAQAREVAEEMLQLLRGQRFRWLDRLFRVTGCAGLATFRGQEGDRQGVLRAADAACHAAKELGRDRLHTYHANDETLVRRHSQLVWAERLNRAIEQDRFILYGQKMVPVGVDDGRRRLEILLRLQDQGELLLPGAFLPAAERFRLMPRIDGWVLRKTIAWLNAQGDDLDFVSINVSGLSLGEAEFQKLALDLVTRKALRPDRICFEITETSAVTNLSAALAFIREMRALGCRFALDDFGAGIASFAYLRSLPVNMVKVDGLFVKGLIEDPVNAIILKSVREIASVLGMQTVAEFVECPQVLAELKTIGFDYAQGYALGKPKPLSGH